MKGSEVLKVFEDGKKLKFSNISEPKYMYLNCGEIKNEDGDRCDITVDSLYRSSWEIYEEPEEELKPCPFCKSKRTSVVGGVKYFVKCNDCISCGPDADQKEFAIKLWNTRTAS